MGDQLLGNVVLSRPFQFAEVQTATPAVIGHRVIWTPSPLKTFQPIKTRWIYAFELGEHDIDQKPILAAEYHADKNGALGFVPGVKRRFIEAKEKGAPVPVAVAAAALPMARQGKRLRYAFIATRARMSTRAIWEMENSLHPIYERLDLADDYHFKHAADAPTGPFFIPVIDPLTLAESLHMTYEQALNEAINFAVVHKNNPNNAVVEIRSRKYQLAKMIKDTLLAPEGELSDPMHLGQYLAGGGPSVMNFVEEHESTARKLEWRRRNTARNLVWLLDSPVWIQTFKWYLGTPPAAKEGGHIWLGTTFSCLDRLCETPEGVELERRLAEDSDDGLLSYLFAPEGHEEAEAEERYAERFSIMRKAATAAVVGFAEMAPALIVHRKTKAANERIQRTIKTFFARTEVSIVSRAPNGRVSRALKVTTNSVHIEVDYRKVKVDLEKWIEEGKPHWPEGTKQAKAGELLGRFFMGIEAVNLYNEIEELKAGKGKPLKVMGAVLDLVVAAEDPIRAFARQLGPKGAAREAGAEAGHVELSAGMRGAAEEAAEKEVPGLFGKLVAPAAFKFLGAASAAIDLYFNYVEANKALGQGDWGKAVGKSVVAAGSFILTVGSLCNGIGYLTQSALLTAASASLLVVGLIIVVVGLALLAYFSTSEWQKFVRHSCFGDQPTKAGHESWSAGNFSEWTETPEGLDRQIEVLTTMLCAFKVAGAGFAAQTITVTFGAIPPKAKLELEFDIAYDNGETRKPAYLIDLETGHLECHGAATSAAEYKPYRQDERMHSILLTADRPESLKRARVQKSSCSVVVRYAQGDSGAAASGTIPIRGRCKYPIFDGSGMGRTDELSSLDVAPK